MTVTWGSMKPSREEVRRALAEIEERQRVADEMAEETPRYVAMLASAAAGVFWIGVMIVVGVVGWEVFMGFISLLRWMGVRITGVPG